MSKPTGQKHHFIPRFILKKFAPANQPPARPAACSKTKTHRRDFLVNKIELESSILTQRPVSTEFTLVDMYRDPGFEENPYHLEKKLMQLEGKASDIINRVGATFAKSRVLELKRPEVDTLRKFLFLMKYRNAGMFERYNHEDAQQYDADDRPRMLRYMATKGFTKPRDVWFDNLRHMLDLEMDASRTWRRTLHIQIYPDDAMMFELHLLHSYMSFCQPHSAEEEFLLTENAFGIFEGPSTVRKEISSCKTQTAPVLYTEYHNFAPISPQLIIILRSAVLPFPGDTGEYAEIRSKFAAALRARHLEPDKAGSILEDLPVRPCKTVYSRAVVDSPASFNKGDRFLFLCFKLSSAHMTTINNLFLEEAYPTSSIIYHSPMALRASVENYFKDSSPLLKQVVDIPGDARRAYFNTLEKILRDLGGSARCMINPVDLSKARVRVHMALNVGLIVGTQLMQRQEPVGSLPRAYNLLKHNASRETFWYDVDQASRLVMLRTKLDGALKRSGLSDQEKSAVRAQIHTFFISFPVERLWLYLKIMRNMGRCDIDDIATRTPELELRGIEDGFAEAISMMPHMKGFIVPKMYFDTLSDIF
ncbi:hypothetical protein BDW62DRAFT_199638 [Aspergillus aurantiobrunneus]